MKKYILIWDKKLQQMFYIYVNNGFNIELEDVKKRLLDRSNIDLDNIDRYITFDSDSGNIYPFYHQPKMDKE